MKNLSIWFAGAAALTGIIAAIFWWISARIDQGFDPAPPTGNIAKDDENKTVSKGNWNDLYVSLFKISDALNAVARLDRWAAISTGISVALSGISSLLGS